MFFSALNSVCSLPLSLHDPKNLHQKDRAKSRARKESFGNGCKAYCWECTLMIKHESDEYINIFIISHMYFSSRTVRGYRLGYQWVNQRWRIRLKYKQIRVEHTLLNIIIYLNIKYLNFTSSKTSWCVHLPLSFLRKLQCWRLHFRELALHLLGFLKGKGWSWLYMRWK